MKSRARENWTRGFDSHMCYKCSLVCVCVCVTFSVCSVHHVWLTNGLNGGEKWLQRGRQQWCSLRPYWSFQVSAYSFLFPSLISACLHISCCLSLFCWYCLYLLCCVVIQLFFDYINNDWFILQLARSSWKDCGVTQVIWNKKLDK